jgi:hypothetical protein
MVIVQLAAVRVDLNIIVTGMAEYLCIHMAAAITPEVKFTAICTERNLTAVTENDGRDFPAASAGSACVFYYNHGVSN